MKQVYRFPDVPEFEGLRVEVEARGRRLTVRPRGRGAARFIPYLAAYSAWLTSAGPIEPAGHDTPALYSLYFPPIPSAAHGRQIGGDLRTLVLKRPRPLAFTLGVTSGCQLACAHCSAGPGNDGGGGAGAGGVAAGARPDLSRADLERVIAEALDLGVDVVTFTGGEPLLRDDLEELVAAVPAAMATTLVFTNGLLLDAARAGALARAGLYGVHLSLDSPDPGEHDRLRGLDGGFAAVEAAAHAVVGAGLKLGISTYAAHGDTVGDRLARIAALAAAWGASEVTVFDAIATGRLFGCAEAQLTAVEHRFVSAEGKRLSRLYGNRPRIVTQSWTNSARGFGRLIGCLAATLQVHVNARGELMPCDFTPLTFGNVRDAPLCELWRRLIEHPEWRHRSLTCRMQDPGFRARYVDSIPRGVPLPYPIAELDI